MTATQLFSFVNFVALAGWFVLIIMVKIRNVNVEARFEMNY